MNITEPHFSPSPEPVANAPVNPLALIIALFFVVGLIFAFLYLWVKD
jgi:hypothetical protein